MDLATLMFIAYRAMDERVLAAVREAGFEVTTAQARVAQRITDEGSRLTDLAARAQVTKQTASLQVAALERVGFVERVPDPTDRRASLIRFTERGRRARDRAQQEVAAVERVWEEHLGPELAGCLREALTRLREVTDPYR